MKSKLTSSLISALEEERLPSWDDNGQPNRMQNRYLDVRHKRFDCVSSGFRQPEQPEQVLEISLVMEISPQL